MIKVRDMEEFFNNRDSKKLLFITRENCDTCRLMRTMVEQTSKEKEVKPFEIDGMINKDEITDLGIKTVPTIILYDGNEIQQIIRGFITKNQLEEYLI